MPICYSAWDTEFLIEEDLYCSGLVIFLTILFLYTNIIKNVLNIQELDYLNRCLTIRL
jgi:hypothetical protein